MKNRQHFVRVISLPFPYHNNLELILWQISQPDLLDSNCLSSSPIQGPVHTPKGSLSQTITQLVSFQTLNISRSSLCGAIFTRPPFRKSVSSGCLGTTAILLLPSIDQFVRCRPVRSFGSMRNHPRSRPSGPQHALVVGYGSSVEGRCLSTRMVV